MSSMKSANILIYTSNIDAQVNTPDPYASASALTTDSWFIKNYLGPTTNSSTMTYDIEVGLNST